MKITREVIVDLLPVYVSGEASPATRTLVEEYLSQYPDLMEQVLRLKSEDHLDFPEVTVPPELAMRSLRAMLIQSRDTKQRQAMSEAQARVDEARLATAGIDQEVGQLRASSAAFASAGDAEALIVAMTSSMFASAIANPSSTWPRSRALRSSYTVRRVTTSRRCRRNASSISFKLSSRGCPSTNATMLMPNTVSIGVCA